MNKFLAPSALDQKEYLIYEARDGGKEKFGGLQVVQ
jgi:hypothetical protein